MADVANERKKRKTKKSLQGNEENGENVAKKRKARSVWVREDRERLYLEYYETESDIPFKFMTVMGIDDAAFNTILKKVSCIIQKSDTLLRQAIPAKLKLQVFLEYVATGRSLSSLARLCHVSLSSSGKFIPEVAEAICEKFGKFIQDPSDEDGWKQIADGFKKKFGADNCVGVVQGKTVYHKTWSRFAKDTAAYLWFAADTQHSLVCVDVGTCHKHGRDFVYSKLFQSMRDKTIGLPDGCYFIWPRDEHLDTCIKTPNSGKEVESSDMSRTASDTFNLFRSRFKLFDSTFTIAPETVAKLLKAACALHNWMQRILKLEVGNIAEMEINEKQSCILPAPDSDWLISAAGSEKMSSAPGIGQLRSAPGSGGSSCAPGSSNAPGSVGSSNACGSGNLSSSPVHGWSNSAPGSGQLSSAPGSGESSCAPGSSNAPGSGNLSSAPVHGWLSNAPGSGGFISAPVSGGFISAPGSGWSSSSHGSGALIGASGSGGSSNAPGSESFITAPDSGWSISAPGSGVLSSAPGTLELIGAHGSKCSSSTSGYGVLSNAPGMNNLISNYDDYNKEAMLRRYELTELSSSECGEADQEIMGNW